MNGPKKGLLLLGGLLSLAACGRQAADSGASSSPSSSTSASPEPSVSVSASGPASESSAAADQAAIRAAGASREDAYKVGNTDFIVSLYAADAVLMPPTAPTATGHAAIRRYVQADIAQASAAGMTTAVPANSIETRVSGDLGFRSGRYSIADKSGATVDTGKWLEVWRKADGKWQIIRDIRNSDTLPLIMPGDGDEEGGTAE